MTEVEAAEAAEALEEETPMAPSVASESAPPDTPVTELKPAPAPRKSGRPPQKRGSRLGRNQYTRDAPIPATNGASPAANGSTPNSPKAGNSNGVNNGHDSSDGTSGHKPSKSRNWRLDKLSWNEIRRPAGAMQSYIAQRQVELAISEKSPSAPAVQSPPAVNGVHNQDDMKVDSESLESFRTLDTMRMMDDLSRELVHWQRMVAAGTEK